MDAKLPLVGAPSTYDAKALPLEEEAIVALDYASSQEEAQSVLAELDDDIYQRLYQKVLNLLPFVHLIPYFTEYSGGIPEGYTIGYTEAYDLLKEEEVLIPEQVLRDSLIRALEEDNTAMVYALIGDNVSTQDLVLELANRPSALSLLYEVKPESIRDLVENSEALWSHPDFPVTLFTLMLEGTIHKYLDLEDFILLFPLDNEKVLEFAASMDANGLILPYLHGSDTYLEYKRASPWISSP